MAGVRDPAFWRRFSLAVHLDEENTNAAAPSSSSTSSKRSFPKRPDLRHTDSWLERQQKKRKRVRLLCWIFWLGLIGLVAGLVIVLLWLSANGKLTAKAETKNDVTSQPVPIPDANNGDKTA